MRSTTLKDVVFLLGVYLIKRGPAATLIPWHKPPINHKAILVSQLLMWCVMDCSLCYGCSTAVVHKE